MTDGMEQGEAQVGPQPEMQIVLRCPDNAPAPVDSIVNVPALNGGAEILNLLREIQQGMSEFRQGTVDLRHEMAEFRNQTTEFRHEITEFRHELRQGRAELQQGIRSFRDDIQMGLTNFETTMHDEFSRQEKNNIARLINRCAKRNSAALEPLFGVNGHLVPDFPATFGDAKALDGTKIDLILVSLGLDTTGGLRVRKDRFYRHIGLAYEA